MCSDFEKSFSDFIDRREYDQAENALFSMVRISYSAGWLAAGGNPPPSRKVIEIHRPPRTIPIPTDPDSIDTDIVIPGDKD